MAANIQVDTITDTAGTGATNFSQGLTVSATKSVKTDILIPQTSGKSIALKGVTDGTAAAAGDVGEVISNSVGFVNSGANTTYYELTSISLTAGEWMVSGGVNWDRNGATFSQTLLAATIIPVGGGSSTGLENAKNAIVILDVLPLTFGYMDVSIPSHKVTLTSTTTYYLKVLFHNYSAGTPKAKGYIQAVRIR